jgi:two-component system OmpR family sensor kinase
MSLRTRLILCIVLVLATLAVTMIAVIEIQREHVVAQVDRQLHLVLPVALYPPPMPGPGPGRDRDPPDPVRAAISHLFIGEIDAQGTYTPIITGRLLDDAPDVTLADVQAAGVERSPFDASGQRSPTRFRVLTALRPDGHTWAVVALPLTETEASIRRLVTTLAVAATVIVAALVLTGWWMIRLGLRPIARVTAVADAIAAGQHDLRVDLDGQRTEAGRLGRAFDKMLDDREDTERRLRQFVADASHELRTPITSILGYLEVYAEGGFRDEAGLDEVMRRLRGESKRMHELVEDLLLLASLDLGRPLLCKPVEVADVLRDAADDARAVQPDRVVTAEVATDGLVLHGDEARLRQVVAALVHNALVHTAPSVPVHLRGCREGSTVVITVADEGPGLAPGTAAHVFDRFYRGDPSRSRHAGGSGLGLPIARSIVEAHHGTITLDSAEGTGCTFRVRLPAGPAPPSTDGG